MENLNINLDFEKLSVIRLMSLNKNKDKIKTNSDILYKLTQDYLKQGGANPIFLDKPSVIERIKYIIFDNLLLEDSTKISSKTIINENSENEIIQRLGILNDGSIMFYNKNKKDTKVFYLEYINEELRCRFFKYNKLGELISEIRVILNEYGFDEKFYEIFSDDDEYSINETFRETYRYVMENITESELKIYFDCGNASITPILDSEYLCNSKNKLIVEDMLDDNLLDVVLFNKDEDVWKARYVDPQDYIENSEYDIEKIRRNYNYYVSRYSNNAKKWFVDRYGKEFLLKNKIASNLDDVEEITQIEKIKKADIEEIETIDLPEGELIDYIEALYEDKQYEKAKHIFKKLEEEEQIYFIEENSNYSFEFLAYCISSIENDDLKKDFLEDETYEFNTWERILIISTIKNEDEKVILYNENLEEILEHDDTMLEKLNENQNNDIDTFCYFYSAKVLESLNNKENIKEFILNFRDYPIIRTENLLKFNEDEINELIQELDDDLEIEEFIAFIGTGKVEDDYIIQWLEKNWDSVLEFCDKYEIDIDIDIEYDLKSYSLSKISDLEKRLDFLDANIDDFDSQEIIIILDDIEDDELRERLFSKYKTLGNIVLEDSEYSDYFEEEK